MATFFEIALFIVVYALALAGVLSFILLGLCILVAPRTAMRGMATIDRVTRKAFMRGEWNAIEKFMVERHWLMPADVDIKTPEDARHYMVSARAVESGRFWIARVWAVVAIALAGFALVTLIAIPFQ